MSTELSNSVIVELLDEQIVLLLDAFECVFLNDHIDESMRARDEIQHLFECYKTRTPLALKNCEIEYYQDILQRYLLTCNLKKFEDIQSLSSFLLTHSDQSFSDSSLN
jgi:hypothetical protein